jgi:hypothetical protein
MTSEDTLAQGAAPVERRDLAPVERFQALTALGFVLHGFTLRVVGLDVRTDRETALQGLHSYHESLRREFLPRQARLAEQVHGNAVAVVSMRLSPVIRMFTLESTWPIVVRCFWLIQGEERSGLYIPEKRGLL